MRPFRRRASAAGGRGGRSDDWPSPHVRARTRAAERLDAALQPLEEAWLDDHLAACDDCRRADEAYAVQRSELRRLRGRAPLAPRDLWARTAAAIEREAGFRAGAAGRPATRSRSRVGFLVPYALLSGALVVAVVVGTLTSSQLAFGDATPPPSDSAAVPSVSPPAASPRATPLTVGRQRVEWLSAEADGSYSLNVANVDEVCPEDAEGCDRTVPDAAGSVRLDAAATTVFGTANGQQLIVIASNDGASTGSLFVVPVATEAPSPTASIEPGPTPTPAVTPSPTVTASQAASPTPTAPIVPTASPSVSPLPDGAIEIARGLDVADTSAAYSSGGRQFAFSARPDDGVRGPDIYTWRAGQTEATAVTDDHRSVFGSWSGDMIVGSSAVTAEDGTTAPVAFLVDPATAEIVPLPQVGRAWRPAVEPSGWSAVYWNGTLEPSEDGLGWMTGDGALVLGRWAAGTAAPTEGPLPTRLDDDDQASERRETTIADGPLADWDVSWDETGTRLAVWIADDEDGAVGRLSLYAVDPFDGRIDLESPVLADAPALAGFSLADGRLVWAEPADSPGSDGTDGRILILAWTDEGSGTVESTTGSVIIVR